MSLGRVVSCFVVAFLSAQSAPKMHFGTPSSVIDGWCWSTFSPMTHDSTATKRISHEIKWNEYYFLLLCFENGKYICIYWLTERYYKQRNHNRRFSHFGKFHIKCSTNLVDFEWFIWIFAIACNNETTANAEQPFIAIANCWNESGYRIWLWLSIICLFVWV